MIVFDNIKNGKAFKSEEFLLSLFGYLFISAGIISIFAYFKNSPKIRLQMR